MDAEIDQLKTTLMGYLDDIGRDSARLHNHQVTREPGRASPKWKDELTSVIGAEAVADIAQNAPRGLQLSVVAIA